ncbi:MAG: magnesium/cobalt transporter CorA [Lewinellaceae bacterium]|nr:magnesium/cobalt transporter CorA [Lewinellaceae bacterium]
MPQRIRKKAGLPPGSVVFTGKRKVEHIDIHYLEYNEGEILEQHLDNRNIRSCHVPRPDRVQWYDMRGLHDTELIEAIGSTFEVHPLVLEDIANTQQRPKFEEYDGGIFLVLQALRFDEAEVKVITEQVSLYFGEGFLLSFQEDAEDLFEKIRDRLHAGRGRIRLRGADYLAYAMLDLVIDHYFLVLDQVEVLIEELEADIIGPLAENTKGKIHHLKQEMLVLRRAIAPLREAISRFARAGNEFVTEETVLFIRDLHDHAIQVTDLTDNYRDMLNSLQDLYISEISLRMNNVMQVLTIITTIFVPLTFLAGIYGMNFDNMPELHWKPAYFVLLGVMFVVALALVRYFRYKKWV